MIRLYTDAATKGNHGIGGVGILIVAPGIHDQTHAPLPAMSNHEAEFAAAKAGFERLVALDLHGMVSYSSDSRLVIDALNKGYAKHYADELAALMTVVDRFDPVICQWIPERQNHGAHALAQQGLHQAEAEAG